MLPGRLTPLTPAADGEPPSNADLDPRMSSTQSLMPSTEGAGDSPIRKLLVVYIHGFMGNKTSFGSFPAHVHAFLKDLLADTHVIHTKIYPRYKTYRSIDLARDNFSKWLTPHESPTTDVVLVGHSMGGLLAAEVVLLVCEVSTSTCP
jgi:pimeloyl-ACP methyl ester carboxylesterase